MSEQEIRFKLRAIQDKYYTPTSKIAEDINMAQSYVGRFINDRMQEKETASPKLLSRLEKWIKGRM